MPVAIDSWEVCSARLGLAVIWAMSFAPANEAVESWLLLEVLAEELSVVERRIVYVVAFGAACDWLEAAGAPSISMDDS